MAEWNEKKEKIEIELAQQIPELKLERQFKTTDCETIALALPQGSVLIEFIRLKVFDVNVVELDNHFDWNADIYIAWILKAKQPENVEIINLGEAKQIDRLIARYRDKLTGEMENRSLDLDLEEPGQEHEEKELELEGFALREKLFDPLLNKIGSSTHIYIAPDGELTQLPLEILPLDNERRIIDKYNISYLNTGRDLLHFKAISRIKSTEPLVFADPDFNLEIDQSTTKHEERFRGRQSRDLAREKLHFSSLPGTKLEGEKIASFLNVKAFLGKEVLETTLKNCSSPFILHLATHGFFLEDQEQKPNQQLQSSVNRLSGQGLENPFLRSGLALAGANTWLKKKTLPSAAEDGILTAEDVSTLNLLGTELVVLSACQTALGQIHTGEGVFGLQRAFTLAGAKTLVMSLWSVSDVATAILMERFYHNLLKRKMKRAKALREAKLYVRKLTVSEMKSQWLTKDAISSFSKYSQSMGRHLEQLSRKHDSFCPYKHPKYWGAFICQGNPGVLPKMKNSEVN